MRRYTEEQEDSIKTERLLREWARSGLLAPPQADRLAVDLKTDLQQTNLFLRIVLFAFGLLIAGASVLLTIEVLDVDGRNPHAVLFFVSAGICFGLADVLARRLYHFGIEESLAVSAVLLTGLGAAVLASNEFFAGLLAAAAAALVVYRRFGYLYAAVASMMLLAASSFQIGQSNMMERVVVVLMLLPIFMVVRDETISALAWAGVYTAINLHAFEPGAASAFPLSFYWATYALTWLLPAIGIYLALKDKNRVFLDVNLVMALVTLVTNKLYLGLERQTWDPILLGVFLIGSALVVRRWLAKGVGNHRYGFTASRLLSSDKRALAFVGTVSTAFQPDIPAPSSSAEDFKPGGGRSGGGGASGDF